MNKDLSCIANLEVPTEKMGQYHHGVLITWGDQTGGGCWSTTGIAEGFNGFANKSGNVVKIIENILFNTFQSSNLVLRVPGNFSVLIVSVKASLKPPSSTK